MIQPNNSILNSCNCLLLTLPGTLIFTATSVLAHPNSTEITQQLKSIESKTTPTPLSIPNPQIAQNFEDTRHQLHRYIQENTRHQPQVTSVSQLSDVQPTDWAFQALQSLVERYGCIAGYPDGTYRGQRAMTRYEFAAGLNACLDRINELIASATDDLVSREDLAALQRLQEEFAAELATLRGRVDALESRTAELEANQFSTTTKLTGEAIFALSAASEGDDREGVFQQRVRLNLNTSFTGKDLLITRLQVGNSTPFDLADRNNGIDFDLSTSEGVQTASFRRY